MMEKLKFTGLLTLVIMVCSCGGQYEKLDTENEQLKKENVIYKQQIDSLNVELEQLKWKLDAQRRIAAKNASIASKGMEPIDLSYPDDE